MLKILFMLLALFALGGTSYLETYNVSQAGPHSAPMEGSGVLMAVAGAAALARRKKGKV